MSKIETDGFISTEAEVGRTQMQVAYWDLFSIIKEINSFLMRFLATTAVDNGQYKLIVHTLLVRVIELFQGTYLMLERGMLVPAESLTRGMLEIAFIIVALEKKPELLQCYLDQHKKNHMQMLRAASEFKGAALVENMKQHNINQLLLEKEKTFNGKALKTLKIKEWAKQAELDDFYNVYYVHTALPHIQVSPHLMIIYKWRLMANWPSPSVLRIRIFMNLPNVEFPCLSISCIRQEKSSKLLCLLILTALWLR